MQRWANNRFKSTIYRVINKSETKRYSIVIFFVPDYLTEIKSLINDEKDLYEPIIVEEYLIQRFNDTYHYR
ncbi:unnamed protein product [Rotaria sp. Silwood2]|nr:unnamed protein product [Rotaria sp. Silwood2]CAF4918264.1 unnamed protein product [Rotaria sp. Silwood2]